MYIIELFFKLKDRIFKKTVKNVDELEPIEEDDECKDGNHIFIPIDSTGKVLACSKCGKLYVIEKGETNPFKM